MLWQRSVARSWERTNAVADDTSPPRGTPTNAVYLWCGVQFQLMEHGENGLSYSPRRRGFKP